MLTVAERECRYVQADCNPQFWCWESVRRSGRESFAKMSCMGKVRNAPSLVTDHWSARRNSERDKAYTKTSSGHSRTSALRFCPSF
jgi:hypothetical protein